MRGIIKIVNPVRISILQAFNKLIVQCDAGIRSYSLELLARVITHPASNSMHTLEASMVQLTQEGDNVLFFRTGVIAERMLGESLLLGEIMKMLIGIKWCMP
jgi:hypothetical protein